MEKWVILRILKCLTYTRANSNQLKTGLNVFHFLSSKIYLQTVGRLPQQDEAFKTQESCGLVHLPEAGRPVGRQVGLEERRGRGEGANDEEG